MRAFWVTAFVSIAVGCEGPPPTPRAPLLHDLAAASRSDEPAVVADAGAAPNVPSPPVARREPKTTTMFGRELVDDYAWLRHKDAPDVVAYLNAENAYAEAMTKPLQPLADALYAEMLSHVQENDTTAPVKDGAWLYYSRTEKGLQYRIECRRRSIDAPEQIVLDPNEIAKTEKYVGVAVEQVSNDGNLLAYGLDTTGFRQFTLHVKDLRTGADLPDRLQRVDSVAFARDGRTLFYATEDAQTKRANQVHRHVLGQDPAKDALVYEEKDERFDVGVARARNRDYVVLSSRSHTTTEERLLDARRPTAAPVLVEPRQADHEYYVEPGKTQLYVRTNSGARTFRVVTAPFASPGRASWKEIVPARPDVTIEDIEGFADHVVLEERKDATVTLRSLDAATGASHPITISEPVYALRPDANPDFASHSFRFEYESPTTPDTTCEEDVRTGARTVLKRLTVPGFDPSRYESERVRVAARDGTMVPVSLVRARGLKADGTHPLLLAGYGAYGIPSDLYFNSGLVSILDRGVVFAIAHVRGGGDLGKAWHDAGRMASKMNTFTDFIDSAEALVKLGWAKRDAIAIEGRSAGGLLVGAVTNMRPDLWRAVLAGVPFVDVLNTMLDESLPLTVGEFEEWGNPKVEEQFRWMAAYSPYDNVAKKDYPAMLVETSYNDSQVMYWEPAKWVARIRATQTGNRPLYLRTKMGPAGHGGFSGRYERMRDGAFDDAFILDQLGATALVAR